MKRSITTLLCLAALQFSGVAEIQAAENTYGFKAKQRYVYDVQIQFGLGEKKNIRKGQITYTVTRGSLKQFTLQQSGNLQQTGVHPAFALGRSFMHFGSSQVSTRFSRNGDELERKGSDVSRSVIGDLPSLIVVPLQDRKSWSRENQLDLSYSTSSSRRRPPFGPRGFGSSSTKRLKATETYEYQLEKHADGSRSVTENYELRTKEKSGKHPVLAADYEGTSTHDAKGIPQTLNLRGNLRSAKEGQVESTAFRITYRKVSKEEVARRAKAKKESLRQSKLSREISGKMKVSDPKPLSETELSEAIALVQSDTEDDLVKGLLALGQAKPQIPQSARVVEALKKPLNNPDYKGLKFTIASLSNRWAGAKKAEAAAKAAAKMKEATPEEIQELIEKMQKERNFVKRKQVMTSLSQTGSPEAADAIAVLLRHISTRRDAGIALRSMGSVAASATVQQLSGDVFTQQEALKVLKVIGTKAELPTIREALVSMRFGAQRFAKDAIKAIEARGK